MFVNIQKLVTGPSVRKNGFDFISIAKKVTNESMGKPEQNVFYEKDVEELKKQSF